MPEALWIHGEVEPEALVLEFVLDHARAGLEFKADVRILRSFFLLPFDSLDEYRTWALWERLRAIVDLFEVHINKVFSHHSSLLGALAPGVTCHRFSSRLTSV